ncbi:MAG: helix-turn-helix domain-containing protein [Clostridia bacterium]|nr:helix-turn-helix domain-containing protein [Clostridia bacterium]
MEILSKRLKELRTERGLTQKQLANALGLAQSSIANWEADTKTPNAQALIILSRYFGVTTDYLLGEQN